MQQQGHDNVIITAVLQFTKLSEYSVYTFTRDVIITQVTQLTVNVNFN